MLSRELLHTYQNKGVEFIINNPKSALWIEMGMGKTVTTLTAIVDLLDSFDVEKVLIIAPLRVANNQWHSELKQWQHTSGLTYSIVTGSLKKRIGALEREADIYIVNRENVKWLVELCGKNWPFDMVVIDESSSFKNHSSQRWKALRKTIPKTDRMVQLTGTPTSNGLLDLYAQVYLLDSGERLGRSMTVFKQRFFDADYMGYNWTPRKGSKEIIYSLLDDLVLTMKAEDYIELPERIDLTQRVDLPPALLKQYKELEKEFLLSLDNHEIEALNAAALANKLLQFCNGAIYTDEKQTYKELHKLKIDALADIVEDNPSENILVAYNYKSDLERLKAKFPQAVELDKEGKAVEAWNAGKIKMLLAHPASAGHGLNLQKGGSMIVWFGLNWSLELVQQFNGRLHRQGQEKPVRVISLVAAGGIDEKVLKAIESKAKTQAELINALKESN